MPPDSRLPKSTCTTPSISTGGVVAGKAFRQDPAVWKTIDYSASNLYDYQNYFHDPDGFDARLAALREATEGKPFFAVELCVNNGEFQSRAYRVAFAMGQLYHKVLTQLDACGVMYCWTLLNVVQPSYGWTRTLAVPDAEHGLTAGGIQPPVAGIRRLHAARARRHAASEGGQFQRAPAGDGLQRREWREDAGSVEPFGGVAEGGSEVAGSAVPVSGDGQPHAGEFRGGEPAPAGPAWKFWWLREPSSP